VSIGRPPRALTVARVQAIEITLDWRWAPVLALATWLLAQNVLPARFPTWQVGVTWLTAGSAVLAGEVALLLHELSHALLAQRHGQRVTRIVFQGLQAQTLCDRRATSAAHELLTALVGPGMNVLLASVAELARVGLATYGPLDVFLLMLSVGNAAAAALSLLPLGSSDGARALGALRRRAKLEVEVAGQRQDKHDEDEQA
jgi:Zn-dependent protease